MNAKTIARQLYTRGQTTLARKLVKAVDVHFAEDVEDVAVVPGLAFTMKSPMRDTVIDVEIHTDGSALWRPAKGKYGEGTPVDANTLKRMKKYVSELQQQLSKIKA